jgi:predicted alpha/beta-fold hydrolase
MSRRPWGHAAISSRPWGHAASSSRPWGHGRYRVTALSSPACMPVISSQFDPPWPLRNGHLQTVLPTLLAYRSSIAYRRERLELADGDFLDFDWFTSGNGRLAILSHGLEGSSRDGTVRGMAAALHNAGWDVLAWNYRGCSEEMNRLPRLYHSGDTADLATVIEYAAEHFPILALVGLSLGGNLVLKYLGESRPHSAVVGAVTISPPVNLAATARALDQRKSNLIYLRRLIASLVRKVKAKAKDFPERIDTRHISGLHGFEDFDGRFTAPVHGFSDAMDYWTKCSSRQFLPAITVPTLILSAQDDPFLTLESFPFTEAEQSAQLYLEAPETGGHLGFLSSFIGGLTWAERRVTEFLNDAIRLYALES